MIDIKKITRNIYKFDLSKCDIEDGYEMITANGVNEFVSNFRKRDLDNGIIVTPGGYTKGLIYKSTNGGEFYNNPTWYPDIVSFTYDLYGLRKGYFYKLTIKARNTRKYSSITDSTDNRKLSVVTDGEEVLIHEDLSEVFDNKEFTTIFRASSTEANLIFTIGKIYINDIIIDEVELVDEDPEPDPDVVIEDGKTKLVAYGIFDPNITPDGKYTEVDRLSGKGIRLFYDSSTKCYLLERDNMSDVLEASFTNAEYFIDFNTNKLPISEKYDRLVVTDIDNGVSPNMLKQGSVSFALLNKNGERCIYDKLGRIVILIYKIY